VIAELDQLWGERRSRRAFHPEPLDRTILDQIFGAAQRAPSWCNTQPWRVAITEPPKTAALAGAMIAAAKSALPHAEVPFVLDYPAPYKELRVACGVALYQAMGIARDDKASRYDAWLRNYAFFGAPHVAVVACDKRLGPYVYVDVGVWLGYLLTAAAALGVDRLDGHHPVRDCPRARGPRSAGECVPNDPTAGRGQRHVRSLGPVISCPLLG
jgi:nitroreductase